MIYVKGFLTGLAALFAVLRRPSARTTLLNRGHLQTVPPGREKWFVPYRKGGPPGTTERQRPIVRRGWRHRLPQDRARREAYS
jgi:hypothetical protein